jgi:branched-subunit amino acid ABC-type transport system permease component
MLAATPNSMSRRLVGIRVDRMLAFWKLASAIGAVTGMMAAPMVYREPNMMRHSGINDRTNGSSLVTSKLRCISV